VFSGSLGLAVYEERERAMEIRSNGKALLLQGYGQGVLRLVSTCEKTQPRREYSLSGQLKKFLIGSSQVEQRLFECLAIGPVLKDYHPALETLGLS
jgi:hypothetical protein